jgi:hypothetical protein
MNANELADALDTIGDKYLVILGDIEFKKAADFVRQQQAEIESLKAEKIRAYDNGYEDGRKPDTNPKLAKTLTDEEIIYLAKRFEGIWSGEVDYKGFARAILRKASEK